MYDAAEGGKLWYAIVGINGSNIGMARFFGVVAIALGVAFIAIHALVAW